MAEAEQPEQRIIRDVKEKFGNVVTEAQIQRPGRASIVVNPERITEVAQYLRDEHRLDHLASVSGVDDQHHNNIIVVYHLGSYSRTELAHTIIGLKVNLDRASPKMPSLIPVWENAIYYERETWEMFGVVFEGHPKLERFLIHEDYSGPPPLRKDYKLRMDPFFPQ